MNDNVTTVATAAEKLVSPVSSYNEWDPLEEIMVGRLENAIFPTNHPVVTCNIPGITSKLFGFLESIPFPSFMVKPAQQELDGLIKVLEDFGVTVARPDIMKHRKKHATPEWQSRGFCNSCPRDAMLVIGEEIIEAPMAWPCRYFETHTYRSILKDYFKRGAKWTAAPKPQLSDELFHDNYKMPDEGAPSEYVINDWEPVFDAADFVRCGRDIFVIKSNVTNDSGIEWLRRHLGDEYRIHQLESKCREPMHIDTTFMPLAPGKVLVNPDYMDMDTLPDMFKDWEILIAPEPEPLTGKGFLNVTSMCGKWLSMNVLMLDEKHVICEEHHTSTIAAFKKWGFEPIPIPFLHFGAFGGAFHCATLDVRRRGTLQSYF